MSTLAFTFGNRCGHDPREPRSYLPPETHKPRPWAIQEIINRLGNFEKTKSFLAFFRILNRKGRKKRTERKEAIISVLQTLFHYLDPITLQVGVQGSNERFSAIKLEKLAEIAGIGLERAERAIRDLQRMGYVKVSRQRHRKENKVYGSKPSIRTLTKHLFHALGIKLNKLRELQSRKRKELEMKFSKIAPTSIVPTSLAQCFKKKIRPIFSRPQEKKEILHKKSLVAESLRLHQLNPSKSLTEIYLELMKQAE